MCIRDSFHTSLFDSILKLFRSFAIELAIIIIGGFDAGVSHLRQILQHSVEVGSIIYDVSDLSLIHILSFQYPI